MPSLGCPVADGKNINFQVVGSQVKQMTAAGVPPAEINEWLGQAGLDLATVNASGYGPTPTSAERPGAMASFGTGVAQGGSMNFGDEIGGAVAATIGRPTSNGLEDIPGATWQDRYESARDEIRGKQKVIEEANPKSYLGGQMVGAIAPAIAAPELYGSKLIANAGSMGGMMAKSGLVAGTAGGISAFGGAEGTPGEQALQTGMGAGTSAILGAAAPPLVKGAVAGAKGGWNKLTGLLQPAETILEQPTMQAAAPNVAKPIQDAFEVARPQASAEVNKGQVDTAISAITTALRRDGYSPEQVKKVLETLGPNGTMADLGRNTRGLLTATTSAPGAAGQLAETALNNRQIASQAGLMASTNKAFGAGQGLHETDAALVKRLGEEASPLYKQAFDAGAKVDVTPVIETIDTSAAKMPMNSPIRKALEKVRGMLGDEIKGPDGEAMQLQPYDDLEMLHNAKLAVDDMLSNYGEGSLGNVSKAKVQEVKRSLLTAMDEASPEYGQARKIFSDIKTSQEALNAGRKFIKEDAESIAAKLADLEPEDQQFFREGAKRAIFDIIKSRPNDVSVVQQLRKEGLLDKVRQFATTEEAFNTFVQDLNNARRFANTRASVLGGSQSVEKALGAADLAQTGMEVGRDVVTGNKAGLIARALGWVSNLTGPGEEARAAIAQRLLSNDPKVIDDTLRSVAIAQRLQDATNATIGRGVPIGASQVGPAAATYGRPQ